MKNIAFDMAAGAEQNLAGADTAVDSPAHRYIVSLYLSLNERFFTNDESRTSHIAFHASFDLNVSG